ncbi:hypothetical protein [uncultured Roseibium sp.]
MTETVTDRLAAPDRRYIPVRIQDRLSPEYDGVVTDKAPRMSG